MSYYREQLEEFLSGLDVKATKVLDIGGQQGEVKKRVRSWQVKEYKVLDLPEYDLQTNWVSRHFTLQGKANVVFCLEVFEYLINPLQAIKNIEFVMKENKNARSKAYISIPLIYPVHNEVEYDSLRYTENGFRRLCKLAGLEVKNVYYRKAKNGLLESYYISDGMRAAKGMDHNITGYIFEVIK